MCLFSNGRPPFFETEVYEQLQRWSLVPKRLGTSARSLDTFACVAHAAHCPATISKIPKDFRSLSRNRWPPQHQPCAPDHLPKIQRIRQTTHRSTVCSPFVTRFTRWFSKDHDPTRAQSPLFVFEDNNLICSPQSRTMSCSQSVFTTKALTFPSPARCAILNAATESQK